MCLVRLINNVLKFMIVQIFYNHRSFIISTLIRNEYRGKILVSMIVYDSVYVENILYVNVENNLIRLC
jgi:hypothetical protein